MIRLYSYKDNFGDELSPYIISKLSGQTVKYRKPFSINRIFMDLLRFSKSLITKRVVDLWLLKYSPFRKIIISIGSILEESTRNTIVWGAGLGSRKIKIKGGKFKAVRGPLSQLRLSELGYEAPPVIGDPALLSSIVYPNNNKTIKNSFKVGIIPHKSDYDDVYSEMQKNTIRNIQLIDLLTPNVENVLDDILSCDYILSSSLHGLIVPHAYNIPAIHFINNKLMGDGSKFIDYFQSVNINHYAPINFYDINFSDPNNIKLMIENLSSVSLPDIELLELQKGLIKVAPFKVLDIYKNL